MEKNQVEKEIAYSQSSIVNEIVNLCISLLNDFITNRLNN